MEPQGKRAKLSNDDDARQGVQIKPDQWCLDYDADEDVLLLVSKQLDERTGILPDARHLVDLPLELLEVIVEPVEFKTILALEAVNGRLKAACHRYTIEYLCCEGDPIALESQVYNHCVDRLPSHQTNSAISADFAGRHVQFFVFQQSSDLSQLLFNGDSAVLPYEPRFTCDHFIYTADFHELDADLFARMFGALKPTNIWLSTFVEVEQLVGAVPGSIFIKHVQPRTVRCLLAWQSRRIAFETYFSRDYAVLEVFLKYMQEWMGGHRQIDVFFAQIRRMSAEQLRMLQHFAETLKFRKFTGRLAWKMTYRRSDGALLQVLIVPEREYRQLWRSKLILTAPGASTAFLRSAANDAFRFEKLLF